MKEIIKIQKHPAEIIGEGFAVSIPTLGIFVNDAENGFDYQGKTEEEKAAMRERVIKKARTQARAAVKAQGERKI